MLSQPKRSFTYEPPRAAPYEVFLALYPVSMRGPWVAGLVVRRGEKRLERAKALSRADLDQAWSEAVAWALDKLPLGETECVVAVSDGRAIRHLLAAPEVRMAARARGFSDGPRQAIIDEIAIARRAGKRRLLWFGERSISPEVHRARELARRHPRASEGATP